MKRQEVIINDLVMAIGGNENFSEVTARDKWEVVAYETAATSGKGIIASPRTMPKPLVLNPGLEGWYKIYVCMGAEDGMNLLELKLSDDEFSRVMGPGNIEKYINWNHFEVIEESYWKAADMTGQSVTIAKPEKNMSYTACLMWLRFVPMSEEEVSAHLAKLADTSSKTMYAHMDEDFTWIDQLDLNNLDDYCRPMYHMKNSDVGIFAQEISNDLCDVMAGINPQDWVTRRPRGEDVFDYIRLQRFKNLIANREAILKKEIAYAHKCNMQYFAAHRMAISNFGFPFASDGNRISFVTDHPEFRCVSRNGKRLAFLSFAYQEVQDYMIGQFKKLARFGADGVTLIFTRGVWVAFEQPVADLFAAKYGDQVSFRRLPNSDPRVAEIKCEVMTGFMRRLRAELDAVAKEADLNRVKIYITSYCSAEEIKNDGIDVESLAREGLIDGVVQSNMTVWEETDDVLDADGLIDLEKYSKKAETEFIIRRSHFNELERITRGLATYNRIASEYGVKLYSEIQWENTVAPEDCAAAAKQIYENSVGGIALWDTYPMRVVRLPEWYYTSRLGSMEHIRDLSENQDGYRKIHKILAYNGEDMSLYNPSWRG